MDKLIAILIGVLAASSAILAIQLVPLATAHSTNFGMIGSSHMGMMSGNTMSGMHNMMGDSTMDCMSGKMSAAEMDKNNDGTCDMCGMQVSKCAQMQKSMGSNGHMMDMDNMPCHGGI